MKKKLIKPRKALQVRKPDGSLLADDGEVLALSAFWLRRIAEGDLEVSDIPVPKIETAHVTESAPKSTKAEK
uniref:DUF2635 domain-containing protein n=1 Tax=Serratia marcescens TaxID=615 RepID=UPI001BCCDA93|nr:DUF2635 domain-containing protein [Serratia marcescens]